MNFSCGQNLRRDLDVSDVTFMNLVGLMESCGYGRKDFMYYEKEEGRGLTGLELIDNNSKV